MRIRFWWLSWVAGVAAANAMAAPMVWGESGAVKLRPQSAPRPETETPLQLLAARNETVAFQVAVHGGEAGARAVSAQLPSLIGPARLGRADFTLYRQTYLDIRTSSGGFGQLGRWPDGLVPDVNELSGAPGGAFPFDVPAGELRGIWVDVHVPPTAPAGVYRGQVEVSGEGFRRTIPVLLSVVEASLSSTPSMASAYLIWPPHVCNAHTGTPDCGGEATQLELLAQYQRLALAHRISLSSFFTVQPDGSDWSRFDALYGPFLDGTRAGRLEGARMTSAQYMGPREDAALAEFHRHFAERGWSARAYDYTGDEPPHGISFAEVKTRAAQVNRAAPSLPTLLTTSLSSLRSHGLEQSIDRLVPLVNFLKDSPGQYEAYAAQPGASLWLYQSCMSHGCEYGSNAPENRGEQGWPSYMVDRSAAKNRAMQWLVFLAGAQGELYYQTVGMLGTAWTDQFRFNGNGDGTLMYPGPLPSVRLKLIRQGVQDYEWLMKVSEAGDPHYARMVARELIPAADRVGDDGEAFEVARKKLIERYLALKGLSMPQWEEPAADLAEVPARGAPEPVVVAPPQPQVAPSPTGPEESAGGCSSTGALSALASFLAAAWLASARRHRVSAPEPVPRATPGRRLRRGAPTARGAGAARAPRRSR